jgi:rhodanese-related sulfurtransferase
MSRRHSVMLERSQSIEFELSSTIPLPVFDSPLAEQPKKRQKLARTKSMALVNERNWLLPVIESEDRVPRITAETMKDIICSGIYKRFFNKVYKIDCRFPYEFDGGHLPGAINSNSPTKLFEQFFEKPEERCLIIFHCEYSQSRGPKIAELFRDHDREINKNRYPFLHYPDVYILDGGYKNFYETYPSLCEGKYVRMHSDENIQNGNLPQCNTRFNEEIQKTFEAKRGNLRQSFSYQKKSKLCPLSPSSQAERKRSCLLASPIPIKKRPQ